jgi:hypothetical protein
MTSGFSTARLGIAVRVSLKSFQSRKCTPSSDTPCLGPLSKNLRLDWLLWGSIARIFRLRLAYRLWQGYTTVS